MINPITPSNFGLELVRVIVIVLTVLVFGAGFHPGLTVSKNASKRNRATQESDRVSVKPKALEPRWLRNLFHSHSEAQRAFV